MDEEPGCRKCETFWGALGILFGVAILGIGIDLITHGAVTGIFAGTREGDNG